MYCRKCGSELPNESLFCNKCGTKTVEEKAVNSDNIEVQSQKVEIDNNPGYSAVCPDCGSVYRSGSSKCPKCLERDEKINFERIKVQEEYQNIKKVTLFVDYLIMIITFGVLYATGEFSNLGCVGGRMEYEATGNGIIIYFFVAVGLLILRGIILGVYKSNHNL